MKEMKEENKAREQAIREMEEREKAREQAIREMEERERVRDQEMREIKEENKAREQEMREIKEKIKKTEEDPAPKPAPVAQWVEDGYVIKGKRQEKVFTYRCTYCGGEHVRADYRKNHVCKFKLTKSGIF